VASHTYLRLATVVFLASLVALFASNTCAQECDKASRAADAPQQIKINIVSVEFPTDDSLSDEIRTQLRREIKKQDLSVDVGAPDSDWLDQLNSVVVRGVFANAGHFKAQTTVTPFLIRAEAQQRFYAVRIEVESGLLYHLGGLRFEDVTVFPQNDLRKLVLLNTGDPFDAAKVIETIESISKLYSTKGYIDMTIEPTMEIDDEKKQIDLTLRLSEQTQYRVGTVEISGLDNEAKNRLASQLTPGSVFDASVLKSFRDQAGRNVTYNRHTRERTVDIVLDAHKTGCADQSAKRIE
jgi:outer membrane translocation and assembly module TamA